MWFQLKLILLVDRKFISFVWLFMFLFSLLGNFWIQLIRAQPTHLLKRYRSTRTSRWHRKLKLCLLYSCWTSTWYKVVDRYSTATHILFHRRLMTNYSRVLCASTPTSANSNKNSVEFRQSGNGDSCDKGSTQAYIIHIALRLGPHRMSIQRGDRPADTRVAHETNNIRALCTVVQEISPLYSFHCSYSIR